MRQKSRLGQGPPLKAKDFPTFILSANVEACIRSQFDQKHKLPFKRNTPDLTKSKISEQHVGDSFYQEYIRGGVCNSKRRSMPRHNFKCIIDDAQPLSFHSISGCYKRPTEHLHARALQKLDLSDSQFMDPRIIWRHFEPV